MKRSGKGKGAVRSGPWNEKFIFGFEGTKVTPFLREMILDEMIGGVVLFSRNIETGAQVSELCGTLQELRSRVSDSPLIISLDQEGGMVNRVTADGLLFPSPMAVAATGDIVYAERIGRCIGKGLRSLGVTMNFAPSVDISCGSGHPVIGIRSYGTDPSRVGRWGAAMIKGLEEGGICAVAKHFPGLGAVTGDPHRELPVISRTREQIGRNELVPFGNVIRKGVRAVMVGHAVYPAFSSGPASLSKEIIAGLLRKELRFGGVVITDDLSMGAVAAQMDTEEVVARACNAGVDLLLLCHGEERQRAALRALSRLIKRRRSAGGELERSVKRIRRLKNYRNADRRGRVHPCGGFAKEVAERAVTLIGRKGAPFSKIGETEWLCIVCPLIEGSAGVEETGGLEYFVRLVRRRHARTDVVYFDPRNAGNDGERLRRLARRASIILMVTHNAYVTAGQVRLAEIAGDSNPRTVFVAIKDPYDVASFPAGRQAVATYGYDRHTLQALVKLLFGDIHATGRLPVNVSRRRTEASR